MNFNFSRKGTKNINSFWFMMILPETDIKQGMDVATKLREEIESAVFEYESERVPVTSVFRNGYLHPLPERIDSYLILA